MPERQGNRGPTRKWSVRARGTDMFGDRCYLGSIFFFAHFVDSHPDKAGLEFRLTCVLMVLHFRSCLRVMNKAFQFRTVELALRLVLISEETVRADRGADRPACAYGPHQVHPSASSHGGNRGSFSRGGEVVPTGTQAATDQVTACRVARSSGFQRDTLRW